MKRIISLLALMAVASAWVVPRDGEVTAIAVQPTPGRAEVVISVAGAVDVRDFTLERPSRIVIDVLGARLGSTGDIYDQATRGGIADIRYAQFRDDVVRVVVELDQARPYEVRRVEDRVILSLATDEPFAAWSTSLVEDSRTPVAAPAAQLVAEPVIARPPPIQQGSPITVSFDSVAISDVIATFAEFANRTIIPGSDVTGTISHLEVRNQPWDVALEAVLDAYGFVATELPSGIIRVDSREALAARDTMLPVETRLIRVNYAPATSLVLSVESVLTENRGRVVADSTTNSLVVTDIISRIDEIEEFVRALDVRTSQVLIQAKLIFVDRLNVEEIGVKYDLGGRNQFFNRLVQRTDPLTGDPFRPTVNVVDLGGNSLAAVGNADARVINPALDLIYSTAIGNFDLTVFLQALQRVELADIQAEPVTTVLDNRSAELLVGDRVPIRIIDVGTAVAAAGGQLPRATVRFQETGIRLNVTPHITMNRQVLLEIHAENSSVRAAPVDIGFTFQTQEATTQVLVSDGETAVIGGLTVTQVNVTKSGIPLLVDLPIIGGLFGFTTQQEIRRDLLILVTPHIIDPIEQ